MSGHEDDSIASQHAAPRSPNPYESHSEFNLENYSLSAEERRVLAECEKDSFKYRSLPLMIFSGGAVHWAVKNAKLKAHSTMGSFPKVALAVGVSYIVGRLSYINECADRIMHLPNSQLAEAIKRKKGLITSDYPGDVPRRDRPPARDFASEFERSNQSDSSSEDWNSQAPSYDYGASARARQDNGTKRSFEELRNENRLQYAHSMYAKKTAPPSPQPQPANGYNRELGSPHGSQEYDQPMPSSSPPPSSYATPPRPGSAGRKNAYGDNWDE